MTRKKEASLRVEKFYRGDDNEFRIHSKKEMLFILQGLVENGTHSALYYDEARNFIMTTVLAATEGGIWLDIGPFPPENKRVLLSDEIIFVSLYQHVKIQFEVYGIQSALFDDAEAFFIELPDYLLRIQRREYFRLSIPLSTPVKCLIPVKSDNEGNQAEDRLPVIREFPIIDISMGGVSLLCEENETELQQGKMFQECRISLPDIGTLTVSIHVKTNIKFTTHNDLTKMRAGCEFHCMSNQANSMLQRYINHLQSESLVNQKI